MSDPAYGIVGDGRWGRRLRDILAAHGREVVPVPLSRRAPEEGVETYAARADDTLGRAARRVDVVWFAVPPGDQAALIRAALGRGCPVVIEKPWTVPEAETRALIADARARGLPVGVHHQFCYLDGLPGIADAMAEAGAAARFSGTFRTARPNRLGIDALDNLGSHLIAIRERHLPAAALGPIEAAYDAPDERRSLRVESDDGAHALDFTENHEPLIQRFVREYEGCLARGAAFPLDLDFALRVRCTMNAVARNESRA